MSAQIIPFDFEDHPVRTVMLDGEPWWVAADVCRVLEIRNPRDAMARMDDDERTTVNLNTVGNTDGNRGNPNATVINESGLFALILTSRKPSARRFRKWVTAEVLPQLRRTGRYGMPSPEAREEISARRLIELLQAENTLLRQKTDRPRRPAPVPTTEEERAEILRLIEEGHSAGQIAKMTGRSTSMISLYRSASRAVRK